MYYMNELKLPLLGVCMVIGAASQVSFMHHRSCEHGTPSKKVCMHCVNEPRLPLLGVCAWLLG